MRYCVIPCVDGPLNEQATRRLSDRVSVLPNYLFNVENSFICKELGREAAL